MNIIIFAGESLTPAQVRRSLPQAKLAPPVRRGDLHRALVDGVQLVGIVDGVFLLDLVVSPTEILDAMRVGVRVFGAGGVGAMRAAELDRLGMTGCGRIYERIRDEPYFRDDHLGLVGASAVRGAVAMVDLEATVARLVSRRLVPAKVGAALLRRFQALHFSERSFARLLDSLPGGKPGAALRAAAGMLHKHHISQKTLDGQQMLTEIRDELARVARGNRMING